MCSSACASPPTRKRPLAVRVSTRRHRHTEVQAAGGDSTPPLTRPCLIPQTPLDSHNRRAHCGAASHIPDRSTLRKIKISGKCRGVCTKGWRKRNDANLPALSAQSYPWRISRSSQSSTNQAVVGSLNSWGALSFSLNVIQSEGYRKQKNLIKSTLGRDRNTHKPARTRASSRFLADYGAYIHLLRLRNRIPVTFAHTHGWVSRNPPLHTVTK